LPWCDLPNEHQFKYRELPPFALFEALKLNLLYADDSGQVDGIFGPDTQRAIKDTGKK
jgi:hypothetical protein